MIRVSRLNGKEFFANAEYIRFVESTPDTVITFLDGAKIVVHESADVVIERILEYQQKIHTPHVEMQTGA